MSNANKKHSLTKDQIERYSRQLLVPGMGVSGQEKLCKGAVLIIGAGGLGCPAGLYLASAGVGTIGFVDYDTVEQSNLHRQVLHTEERVGHQKADSACIALRALNSSINLIPYAEKFQVSNALTIIGQFDVVIDASDNAVTRYLINDACIMAGKPLVSGAALRWEGQITTYNYKNGPCYRCLYPQPPPAAAVTNCDTGGIVGAVTGCIGTLQAMEAIKILIGTGSGYSGKLVTFDGTTGEFRSLKLRQRSTTCICSNPATATLEGNYELFCNASATDKTPSTQVLSASDRLSCRDFCIGDCALLIDVRPSSQYEICSIPDSINVPYADLPLHKASILDRLGNDVHKPIVTICRRGNQSQQAVLKLRSMGFPNVKDLIGGMRSWSLEVDPTVPIY